MIVRIILALALTLVGCKKRDGTPETRDPIYGDLTRQLEEQTREVDSIKRDLETAKKDFEVADPQNGEVKVRRQAIFDLTMDLDKELQKQKYLELQIASRKEFARKSYDKAFDKDLEWPDPTEFRLYKSNQRLVRAPKSYDETHKKRLEERKPANVPQKKEKAAPAH